MIFKFLLKYKKFFNPEARKFLFVKYKKFFQSKFFFHFSSSESYFLKYNARKLHFCKYKKVLREKVLRVEVIFCKKFHRRLVTMFWIYQNSEYSSSSKYAKFLNMLGFWIYLFRNIRWIRYVSVMNILFRKYKKVTLCQGSQYTFPEI